MDSKLLHAKEFKRWCQAESRPAHGDRPRIEISNALRNSLNFCELGSSGGIDATEMLRRSGYSQREVVRLATQFGQAAMTACEGTQREMAPIIVGVRRHHEHGDAKRADSAHKAFQQRELYRRVCPTHGTTQAELD